MMIYLPVLAAAPMGKRSHTRARSQFIFHLHFILLLTKASCRGQRGEGPAGVVMTRHSGDTTYMCRFHDKWCITTALSSIASEEALCQDAAR